MPFDSKTAELIAIGASVAANCLPCLQTHKQNALAAGLTEQEITEAINVGKVVRAGAAGSMDQLIKDTTHVPTG
ncbi:MAG: carboxymuconolactone decarboxylase family protein [Firmicutes bacterium]|nr:carboxymuconolactone decarboxylase family protein [Bacillota bacterium]